MPMFTFKIAKDDGPQAEQRLGLYHGQAAMDYARRLAHNSRVEIWDEGGLVGTVESGAPVTDISESSL